MPQNEGRPSTRNKPAKDAQIAARRRVVATMRSKRRPWHEIAAATGVSIRTCREDLDAVIEQEFPAHVRTRLRAEILMAYDQQFEDAAKQVDCLKGWLNVVDEPAQVADVIRAIDAPAKRMLTILAAIRKMGGLDEPAQVDVTSGGETIGGITEETLAGFAAQVSALVNPSTER